MLLPIILYLVYLPYQHRLLIIGSIFKAVGKNQGYHRNTTANIHTLGLQQVLADILEEGEPDFFNINGNKRLVIIFYVRPHSLVRNKWDANSM